MGVRLVVNNYITRYVDEHGGISGNGTLYHDELLHLNEINQHPIYAITGLQEVLNTIELHITDIYQQLIDLDTNLKHYTDTEIKKESDIINDRIDNLKILENVEDSEDVDLSYDYSDKTLKAEVIRYDDPNNTNSLRKTQFGLYVPKLMTEDSSTVSWKSDTVSHTLSDFFRTCIRFSHNDTSEYINIYDLSDTEWSYNDTNDSLYKEKSTETYNGIISKNLFDSYFHSLRISSISSEDNINGIVLAFMFDEYERPHTLSLLLQRGNNSYLTFKCAIVYNFKLPGEQVVLDYNLLNSNSGWDTYSRGISLFIEKSNELFDIHISPYGFENTANDLDTAKTLITSGEEHNISFSLEDFSWGYYFIKRIRYGYSNMAQADSYFDKIFFLSYDMSLENILSSHVKVSKESDNEIYIKDDGIYSEKFKISGDNNNALTKHEDGYYVSRFSIDISNTRLNGLINEGNNSFYVHKSHSFVNVTQVDNGFSVGDFIYYDTRTFLYQKAIAIDSFDVNIVGMVSYIYDKDTFEFVCNGFVETNLFNEENQFVQGLPLYISEEEPGKVTQDQPNISKTVGYPINNIGIIISIERGINYHNEAQYGDFKTSANDYNVRSDGFIKVAENIDYKLSLVQKFINKIDNNFKNDYLVIDNENGIMNFKNTSSLIKNQNVPNGMNLFIKAF